MRKLLHLLALAVSLSLGFVLCFFLLLYFDILNSFGTSPYSLIFWLIGVGLFSTIIKKFFFSEDIIQEAIATINHPQRAPDETSLASLNNHFTTVTNKGTVIVRTDQKKITERLQPNPKNASTESTQEIETPVAQTQDTVIAEEKPKNSEVAQKTVSTVIKPIGAVTHNSLKTTSETNFLHKFFAENFLAKIGGILLFLGVVFLLQLVYTKIGPHAKLAIGFLIGLSIYSLGIILDRKKYTIESRVLLGTGILINYLVILAGRFLLGNDLADTRLLSEGITFVLLVLNTLFAIITSLVYHSHALLMFSFVFAYLNPFLINTQFTNTPYTLISYAMVLSLGALVLSFYLQSHANNYSKNLQYMAFLGGNVLLILAPYSTEVGWISKLAATVTLSLITIYCAYRHNLLETIFHFFIGSYIFLFYYLAPSDVNLFLLNTNFSFAQSVTAFVAIFTFIIASYYLCGKKELNNLYLSGNLFGAILLLMMMSREGDLLLISKFCASVSVLLSLLLPFVHKNLFEDSSFNLPASLIVTALFGSFEIFYFGELHLSLSNIGLFYLAFSLVYFVLGYITLKIFAIELNFEQSRPINSHEIAAYSFLGIATSLFSLAIAFIFSQYDSIIAVIWLFEATVFIFFYGKTRNIKFFIASLCLLIIGFIKLSLLLALSLQKDYMMLIPLFLVALSLVINLKFLEFEKNRIRESHDVLHCFIMALVITLITMVIPNHQFGFFVLTISVLSTVLALIYSYFYVGLVKQVFVAAISLFFIYHITHLDAIFHVLRQTNYGLLISIQYLSTALLVTSVFIFNYRSHDKTTLTLNIVSSGYLFIISTQYIYDLFNNNIFSITIYWGILAFSFCGFGIQKDLIKFRTVGLYILILTVSKILFYDIWAEIDDAVARIIALMLTGAFMIGLSLLYTKKYGDNLKGELSLNNLV